MRKQLLILLALAILSLGFAPAPFPRRERSNDDAKKIEGTWVQGATRLVIGGGRLTYNPETTPYRYTLKVDASKRPATYDITGINGGAAALMFLGIYRVEG